MNNQKRDLRRAVGDFTARLQIINPHWTMVEIKLHTPEAETGKMVSEQIESIIVDLEKTDESCENGHGNRHD